MRRILLAAAAAAVSAGAVVAVAPRSSPIAAAQPGISAPVAATPKASPRVSKRATPTPTQSGSKSSAPQSSAPQSSAPRSTAKQTIDGPQVSNGWGPFQVRVTTQNGRITAVEVPVIPQDGRSRFINSRAVPILIQEALQAQSAKVNGVSGATDSSNAFVQSLTAALQQAN